MVGWSVAAISNAKIAGSFCSACSVHLRIAALCSSSGGGGDHRDHGPGVNDFWAAQIPRFAKPVVVSQRTRPVHQFGHAFI